MHVGGRTQPRTQQVHHVIGPISRLTIVVPSVEQNVQVNGLGVRPHGFVDAQIARGWLAGIARIGSITG